MPDNEESLMEKIEPQSDLGKLLGKAPLAGAQIWGQPEAMFHPTPDFMKAFAVVQGQLQTLEKSKTVTIESGRGSFSYTYTPLDVILEHIHTTAAEQVMATTQGWVLREGQNYFRTTIMGHGGWIHYDFGPRPEFKDPKQLGVFTTYLSRYCLSAAWGVGSSEDIDAPEDPTQPEPRHKDTGATRAQMEAAEARGKTSNPSTPTSPSKSKPSTAPPSETPGTKTTTNFEFLKAMAEQKERVGQPTYYVILLRHGYYKGNDVLKREDQTTIFRDLKARPDKEDVDHNTYLELLIEYATRTERELDPIYKLMARLADETDNLPVVPVQLAEGNFTSLGQMEDPDLYDYFVEVFKALGAGGRL